MKGPSIESLPAAMLRPLRVFAERVADQGRVWLVGGAVRDLALGRDVQDLDVSSALTPEEIEAVYPRALSVGRAFGTVLVNLEGVQIQHTTFRTEGSYVDGRRPEVVQYGHDLESDAERRDFTCNALYLDPLTDDWKDPTGGLQDLERGVLRCVGEARERFAEDGLRLIRMARFAAAYDLTVEPETVAAAREELGTLRGISAERLYGELDRIAARPGSVRALRLLDDIGALGALRSRFGLKGEAHVSVMERLTAEGDPDLADLLAVFVGLEGGEDARSALVELRAPRAVIRELAELFVLRDRVRDVASAPASDVSRAERIRVIRERGFARVVRWLRASDAASPAIDDLEAFANGLKPDELEPAPLLESRDLAAAGVAAGPAFGELLREAETLQLDGTLATRDDALAWLAKRAGDTHD